MGGEPRPWPGAWPTFLNDVVSKGSHIHGTWDPAAMERRPSQTCCDSCPVQHVPREHLPFRPESSGWLSRGPAMALAPSLLEKLPHLHGTWLWVREALQSRRWKGLLTGGHRGQLSFSPSRRVLARGCRLLLSTATGTGRGSDRGSSLHSLGLGPGLGVPRSL